MPKIPINFKEVMDTTGSVTQEQSKDVHVAIIVDRSAPEVLRSMVKAAFMPQSPTAFLTVSDDSDVSVTRGDECDLIVVVAGARGNIDAVLSRTRLQEAPVVVVVDSLSIPQHDGRSDEDAMPAFDTVFYAADDNEELHAQREFLDDLGAWIVDHCDETRVALAKAFPFIRRPLADEIIKGTAVENALMGAIVFIPGADLPVMTINQIKMVLQIAAAYDQKIGLARAKEIAGVIAGGFACRAIARQAVNFLPGIGWAMKAGIGYSGTVAMGVACVDYFEGGGVMEGLGDLLTRTYGRAVEAITTVNDQRKTYAQTLRKRREEGVDGEVVGISDIIIEPLSLH